MLQRDRNFRTQVHQLTDACVFATSFWLAFALRSNETFSNWLNLDVIGPDSFIQDAWLYFALLPAAPLVLESQGFYTRPMLSSRAAMFWPLLKGCFILTIGLVLLLFMFKESNTAPRGVMVFFGMISFGLVWLKEESLRMVMRSRMAKAQYKRRIIVAGTPAEIVRLRKMVQTLAANSLEVVAEFNLPEHAPPQLIELLHEHSVSGVLVSARHTQFDRVEAVIQLCETCLLYTSDAADDLLCVDLGGRRI